MSEFGQQPIPEELDEVVEEHDIVRPLSEVEREIERDSVITEAELLTAAEIIFQDSPETVEDIKNQLTGRYSEPASEEAMDYLYTVAMSEGISPDEIDRALLVVPEAES